MSTDPIKPPKAFISYSWSSPEHEEWVLHFATDLRGSGVDVVLDKWDLKKNDNKYAFMERMVTDPTILKVIIICDRLYTEKADKKEGGAGTETLIISPEIYDKIKAQDEEQKFVAIIRERDENGKEYVPAYLKGRIYIDLSRDDFYADGLEQVIRWAFDKPIDIKPDIGKPPAFIIDEDAVNLGTSSRFRLAINALRQNREQAYGLCNEYFDLIATNLERFRIKQVDGKQFDDLIVESINEFLPFRDEIIDVILNIARYRSDIEIYRSIHHFFETLAIYLFRPRDRNKWHKWDAVNFKFIVNELFLYSTAALLIYERFEGVNELLSKDYLLTADTSELRENDGIPYSYFYTTTEAFESRNQRLQSRRLSIVSDMIVERAKLKDFPLRSLYQADLLLYIRSIVNSVKKESPIVRKRRWWPHILLYSTGGTNRLEIFSRAESNDYFQRMKSILDVESKEELVELVKYIEENGLVPQWELEFINLAKLMNLDRIAINP